MQTLETLAANELIIGRTLDYTRFVALVYQHEGHASMAADTFAARYPRSPNVELIRKAAVGAGTTTDGTWAGPLVSTRQLSDAFVDYLRPLTIVGRLPLRSIPFKVNVPIQTGAGVYAWTGEGAPKPMTKAAYGSTSLDPRKVSGIIVVTDELLRLAVPNAEVLLRDEIINGLAQLIDLTFVDETIAGNSSTPASVTNGVVALVPSGTTPAALAKDVGSLLSAFWVNNPGATRARLVLGPNHAAMLAAQTNSQTLTTEGGSYGGVLTVVSGNVGARIIALDAAQVLVADGGVELDISQVASLQMDSVPDNPPFAGDGSPTNGTVFRSLFQENKVGIRGERMTNWKRTRTTAVSWLGPTAYVS